MTGLFGPLDDFQAPVRVPGPMGEAELSRIVDEASRAFRNRVNVLPDVEPKFTGPAMHETEVRAAALLAASNMVGGTTGFHPHASDVRAWETRVLDTARRFERYINGTTEPKGSEDHPR